MKDWASFSEKVCHHSACDGFSAIHLAEKGDLHGIGIIEEGWLHKPPHHYLEIKEDGTCLDLTKQAKDDLQEILDKGLEYQQEEQEEYFLFLVECKSGWVPQNPKLKARTGFWTRIVSKDLDAAVSKTIELWKEEGEKTKEQIFQEEQERESNSAKHLMARMRNYKSLGPLLDKVKFLESFGGDRQAFFSAMDKRQLWWIAKFLGELESDIEYIRKESGDKLTDPALLDFLEELRGRRSLASSEGQEKAQEEGKTAEQVMDSLREDLQLVETFLQSWNI